MTTSEQIAKLLLKGEEQGWLTREEIDELASSLAPDARAFLLKRVALHGIEIKERGEATAAGPAAMPSRAAR